MGSIFKNMTKLGAASFGCAIGGILLGILEVVFRTMDKSTKLAKNYK